MLLKTKIILAVAAVGVSAIAGVFYEFGYSVAHNAHLEQQALIAELTARVSQERREKERLHFQWQNQLAVTDTLRLLKQQVITEEIEKEVIRYVESPDSGQCDLSSDWVRIHNAATANRVSSNADSTDDVND